MLSESKGIVKRIIMDFLKNNNGAKMTDELELVTIVAFSVKNMFSESKGYDDTMRLRALMLLAISRFVSNVMMLTY